MYCYPEIQLPVFNIALKLAAFRCLLSFAPPLSMPPPPFLHPPTTLLMSHLQPLLVYCSLTSHSLSPSLPIEMGMWPTKYSFLLILPLS
jgi:hypothetical protein